MKDDDKPFLEDLEFTTDIHMDGNIYENVSLVVHKTTDEHGNEYAYLGIDMSSIPDRTVVKTYRQLGSSGSQMHRAISMSSRIKGAKESEGE